MRFFDIPLIFEREKKAAIHLTSLVKQHKILKIKQKWLKIIKRLKGNYVHVEVLPDAIITQVMIFLNTTERFKMMRCCKSWHTCFKAPCLWK
jgi:hypothetical protein